jgi:hypothetical protein
MMSVRRVIGFPFGFAYHPRTENARFLFVVTASNQTCSISKESY